MGLDKNNCCLYVFYCISFATFYLISVKLAQGFHWKLFLRGVPTVLQGQHLQTVLLESFNPLIKVVHGLCLILHNTGDDSVFYKSYLQIIPKSTASCDENHPGMLPTRSFPAMIRNISCIGSCVNGNNGLYSGKCAQNNSPAQDLMPFPDHCGYAVL